jgi:hypothetical protein
MRLVVSVTLRPRFTPRERTLGTHWIGGWVGLRAGLDTEAKGEVLLSARDRTPVILSVCKAWYRAESVYVSVCEIA